ncbi:hypothetical protein JTE90_012238 [Oedothorax gibbosus]|uniref:Uncharacterized protein n=1 Tax=Oedothorax gibbosus TaxID=931172 RepID=A0AAV6UWF8_9ARAC|nr:hypothetical protein JTE90_012238 [Oedothorax gibbosus]
MAASHNNPVDLVFENSFLRRAYSKNLLNSPVIQRFLRLYPSPTMIIQNHTQLRKRDVRTHPAKYVTATIIVWRERSHIA